MANQTDEAAEKKSVAAQIVQSAGQYRLWSMIFGCLLSFFLLAGGVWLTQLGFGSAGHVEGSGQLAAQIGLFKLVAKNTAPGLVLIVCGTWIATVSIKRKSRAKTQWDKNEHPGYTEVDG